MSIKLTLTDKQVQKTLTGYIETGTTAVRALQDAGAIEAAYDDMEYCKRVVAQVLHDRIITPHEEFPSSRACVAYGLAVAAYIITNH